MARPYRRNGSKMWYVDIWRGGKKRQISLRTPNFGVAAAMARRLEFEADTTGVQLPTNTPVGPAVQRFVEYLFSRHRPRAVQRDVYRLREFLGPVCEALKINTRVREGTQLQRRKKHRRYRRPETPKQYHFAVKVNFLEEVTTRLITGFLTRLIRERQIQGKTAGEYREILVRLFRWAVEIEGIRFPGDTKANPAEAVPRYKVKQPTIPQG